MKPCKPPLIYPIFFQPMTIISTFTSPSPPTHTQPHLYHLTHTSTSSSLTPTLQSYPPTTINDHTFIISPTPTRTTPTYDHFHHHHHHAPLTHTATHFHHRHAPHPHALPLTTTTHYHPNLHNLLAFPMLVMIKCKSSRFNSSSLALKREKTTGSSFSLWSSMLDPSCNTLDLKLTNFRTRTLARERYHHVPCKGAHRSRVRTTMLSATRSHTRSQL